jgi:hypothetical protein
VAKRQNLYVREIKELHVFGFCEKMYTHAKQYHNHNGNYDTAEIADSIKVVLAKP